MNKLISVLLCFMLSIATILPILSTPTLAAEKDDSIVSSLANKEGILTNEINTDVPNRWVNGPDFPEDSELGYEDQAIQIDGKIYVSQNSYRFGPQKFLIYDIENSIWSVSAVSPTSAKLGYTSFVAYNNKIYCFGETYDIYDVSTDSWTIGGTLHLNYYFEETVLLKSVLYNDKVYLFHRFTYSDSDVPNCNRVHVFDLVTDTMTDGGPIPKNMDLKINPVVYDGKIYLPGSIYGEKNGNYLFVYNILDGTWSDCGTIGAFTDNSAILYQGKIYILDTDYVSNSYKQYFSIYDIASDTWSKTSYNNGDHYSCNTILADSLFYVVGSNKCYIYDLEKDQWSVGSDLLGTKMSCSTVMYQNKLYTVGINAYVMGPDAHSLEIYTPGSIITSVPQPDGITVPYNTSPEALQTQLESLYGQSSVELNNGASISLPVIWDISSSGYNGSASGPYEVHGILSLAGHPEIATPVNNDVVIEVMVAPEYRLLETWEIGGWNTLKSSITAKLYEESVHPGKYYMEIDGTGAGAKAIMDFNSSVPTRWNDYKSGLVNVTVSGTISYIGNSMFSGCTNLEAIVLSEGIGAIAAQAFKDCTALTDIALPASLGEIGSYAFSGCNDLTSITFFNSGGMSIGNKAFSVEGRVIETSVNSTSPTVRNYNWPRDYRVVQFTP